MEKDSRRNSILKPNGMKNQIEESICKKNQLPGIEYDEEHTENFPLARRRSMKRVSFSVKDEIKEFQKHEVLNVEKLEQALNMMQNGVEKTSALYNVLQKENLSEIIVQQNEFLDGKDLADVNMEIAASAAASVYPSNAGIETVSCSVGGFMNLTITYEKMSTQEELNMVGASSARQTTSNDNVEMLLPAECRDVEPELKLESTDLPLHRDSDKECETYQLVVQKDTQVDFTVADRFIPVQANSGGHNATSSSKVHVNFLEDELGEFCQLLEDYHWKALNTGSHLILSKIYNCIILKFHLSNEYIHQNVRHYVISDVEIDTKKGMEDKWAKLGLTMLETTLENNCSVKSVSRTTQDLAQLLVSVENYFQYFLEFIIKDSQHFELLVNPRSLKMDLDGLELSFDLSNEQNLLWVRISLTLNPTLPISARSVMIDNIIGNTNKTELTNMILTIRPSGQYLTRVAECIEDFLKFRRTSECNVLD